MVMVMEEVADSLLLLLLLLSLSQGRLVSDLVQGLLPTSLERLKPA
jgi:hypothetical protein